MGICRTLAVISNKGLTGCWVYGLAFDETVDWSTVRLGVDDQVRVVSDHCGKAPVCQINGSGVCADHLAELSPRMLRLAQPLLQLPQGPQ